MLVGYNWATPHSLSLYCRIIVFMHNFKVKKTLPRPIKHTTGLLYRALEHHQSWVARNLLYLSKLHLITAKPQELKIQYWREMFKIPSNAKYKASWANWTIWISMILGRGSKESSSFEITENRQQYLYRPTAFHRPTSLHMSLADAQDIIILV